MSQTPEASTGKKVDSKPSASASAVLPPDELHDELEDAQLGPDHLAGPAAGPVAANAPLPSAEARRRPPLVRQKGFRGETPEIRKARQSALGIPDADLGFDQPMILPGREMGKGDKKVTVPGEGDNGSVFAGTPRTLADAASMTDDEISAYPGAVGTAWPPGPQARPIMMDAFGSNWFFAKDVLLSKKWPEAISAEAPLRKTPALAEKLMWKLLALRTYEYDGILHLLRERYKAKDPDIKKDDDVLKWGSAGSVTITSDIDVNLGGKYNMEAVADFNAEFAKRGWPYEAGTVFDVNVYCKDNMHGFGFEKIADQEADLKKGKNPNTAVMKVATEKNMPANVASEERDASNQEVAAMIKLIRFMSNGGDHKTSADWQKYKKALRVDDATPLVDRPKETYAKVLTAESRYTKWRYDLMRMKQRLVRDGKVAEDQLDGVAQDAAKKAGDALDMQASNRLYEKKIEKLKKLRARLEELAAAPEDNAELIRETSIELRQVILEAGMFANEAMITAGASNFVVFGTQVGAKKDTRTDAATSTGGKVDAIQIKLTEAQFYHAFTEQLADTIKEFHHFDSLDDGLWKGGKYLMRMTLAADQLSGVKDANIPNYEKLRELGDFAMTAKDMDGALSDKLAVLWKALKDRFPGLKGPKDVHGFLDIVVTFGTTVAATYQSAKAGVVVPPKPADNDPDKVAKSKARDDAMAEKMGSKLRLAAVKGADLSATIAEMSDGKVTAPAS